MVSFIVSGQQTMHGGIITDNDCEIGIHATDYHGYMFSVNQDSTLHSVFCVNKCFATEGATVVVYCHRENDTVTVWYIERETGRLLQRPHCFSYRAGKPLVMSVCMRAVGGRMEIQPTECMDYQLARVNVWRHDRGVPYQ